MINGNYSIDIGTYTGPVLLEATGGTYTDEATGTTVALASPLRSIIGNATGSQISVAITALTELAYQDANSVVAGLTSTRIQSAIASVQTNFGVSDIVNTQPADALNLTAGATAEERKYALALATISQYQKSLPVGTSLNYVLQSIQACLSNPGASCGSGSSSVGTTMTAAMNTFQAVHPEFSGMTIPAGSFGASQTSHYQTAYRACYVDTPLMYTATYCAAYAAAIDAGSTPGVANQKGAMAEGGNVGNIGMGGTVTATGTPPTGTSVTDSAYDAAFNTCYVGTPIMYTTAYCSAYATAIAAGSAPSAANQLGAIAAGSNVGNIGMGGTVSATGTASSGSTTLPPSYLDRAQTSTFFPCASGAGTWFGVVEGQCKELEMAWFQIYSCGTASATVSNRAHMAVSVCYANNSLDPFRTRFVNSANYYASAAGLPAPTYRFVTVPVAATAPVYELGVATLNPYTSAATLSTSCLQLPSADNYKLIFNTSYLYHSLYTSASACQTAGAAWVASGGVTPGMSVAEFKAGSSGTGAGTGSSGELAASTACLAQPYLGAANDPQVDSFAKIAQFDACLHRAGYTQYDVEGRANCKLLDGLLQATGSTWTTQYCPYPF